MAGTKKNQKTVPIIAFFFIFVFLMAIIKPGANKGVTNLTVPDNKGIPKLSANETDLIASQTGGGFYLFQWANLENEYTTFPSLSEKSLLLDQNPKYSLSYAAGDLVALGQDGREQFRIAHDKDIETAYMITDRRQKTIIFVGKKTDNKLSYYSVKTVNLEGRYLTYLWDSEAGENYDLSIFDISDDGSLFAAAGRKDDRGYIAVIDILDQKVVWEKQFPEDRSFTGMCFSSDGRTLFAGSEEGTVSLVNAQTGERRKTVVLVEEPRKTTNSKSIQTLVSSSKGTWFACACDPVVFVLDQESCTLNKSIASKHKIVTGIVFSPDETMLATSDLRASGVISIIDLDNINAQ